MGVGSFTRTIKVQQLEAALRNAVAAHGSAATTKARQAKARAIRKLAARLLTARLQVLRSRIADMQPMGLPDSGARSKMARLMSGGVSSILAEFRAQQL